MVKVGRDGKGLSKNCTGKLLVMPPSENQQRFGTDFASVLALSKVYNGMALSNIGKLKLMRTATTTGKSSPLEKRHKRSPFGQFTGLPPCTS